MGMPEGKRPLGTPRRRRVDNIKIGLRMIGWEGMDSIDLAQDELSASLKCWEDPEWLHNWQLLRKGSTP
jgi:hypothetical protein